MRVICDIETDSLNPTKVWLVVTRNIDNPDEVKIYRRPDTDERVGASLIADLLACELVVGHHFIGFDYLRVIRRFWPQVQDFRHRILDTLVLSRLLNFNIEGGHSLEAWGIRLKTPKLELNDFSQGLTEKVIERCVSDTLLNYKLFKLFERFTVDPSFAHAIRLEHDMEFVTASLSEVGQGFDFERASILKSEIDKKLEQIDASILTAFPPRYRAIREVTPRATKLGTLSLVDFRWAPEGYDYSVHEAGAPFTRVEPFAFNPGSPKQIVERLNEAGWKPFVKTKGHIACEQELRRTKDKDLRVTLTERLQDYKTYGWSICEENLDTLPPDAPEGAKLIAQRIILNSRSSVLNEWLTAYNPETKSIHGRFLSIGSWTHRMAHQAPNQANIPSNPDIKDKDNPTEVERLKLQYSSVLRSLFRARDNRVLVGVDADGIQLRVLAHYMNDQEFIKALVEGDKKDKTDVHTLNAIKLGLTYLERDRAKTFIYAWVLNAGVDKVAEILHTTTKEARDRVNLFLEGYPGLKHVKRVLVPADAERGYFVGLDGRKVKVENEHKVLAGYLQNGEQLIMKKANIIWRSELEKDKIPYWQVNFVHDEWQTETLPEFAELVKTTQVKSIELAARQLNLKLPFTGSGRIGKNWLETH